MGSSSLCTVSPFFNGKPEPQSFPPFSILLQIRPRPVCHHVQIRLEFDFRREARIMDAVARQFQVNVGFAPAQRLSAQDFFLLLQKTRMGLWASISE